MRSVRKIKPTKRNNFAVNESSMLSNAMSQGFTAINLAGFFIGLLSVLVGGFSVANIMFVSVKERTPIIGIQKSLGAKQYFILFQFLFEAVFLCIIGGLAGLLIIGVATLTLNLSIPDFEIYFSVKNIIIGLGLSSFFGIVSGIIPAYRASNLDPVVAIRS